MSELPEVDELPGIGHNRPPLEERLIEEVAPLAARQTAMLEVARRAVIIDDASEAKVADLGIQVRALKDEIVKARDETLQPYLVVCDLIHTRYDPLIRGLEAAYGNRTTGLRGMINEHERKREALAEAERQRLRDEQRQREAEAEEARSKAEAARKAGRGTLGDELAARAAEDAADAASQRAAAVRYTPVRSTLGQVTSTRTIAWEVTDLRKVLGWAIKQPMVRIVEAEARKWVGAYLRQLGVDAVERGVEIPGVKSWIERSAGSRR